MHIKKKACFIGPEGRSTTQSGLLTVTREQIFKQIISVNCFNWFGLLHTAVYNTTCSDLPCFIVSCYGHLWFVCSVPPLHLRPRLQSSVTNPQPPIMGTVSFRPWLFQHFGPSEHSTPRDGAPEFDYLWAKLLLTIKTWIFDLSFEIWANLDFF